MTDRKNSMQIINQATKDMLGNRLKRDELMRHLFERRIKLCDLSIIIEAEHIKIEELKISLHEKMKTSSELHKKAYKNNIRIEMDHKKMAEMKLDIIKQLIPLDNENLTRNFDLDREVKIGKLTDDMNFNTPDKWDENKEKYMNERTRLQSEIKKTDMDIMSLETLGKEGISKIAEYTSRKNKMENEILELTERILPLNDLIPDEPEHHPATFIRVAETDPTNPEDVFKNISQE